MAIDADFPDACRVERAAVCAVPESRMLEAAGVRLPGAMIYAARVPTLGQPRVELLIQHPELPVVANGTAFPPMDPVWLREKKAALSSAFDAVQEIVAILTREGHDYSEEDVRLMLAWMERRKKSERFNEMLKAGRR